MELMPVVSESTEPPGTRTGTGSVVDNSNSEVNGDAQRDEESNDTIAEKPRQEKKGLWRRVSQWKWKNIFTAAILWLGYLSVNAAYSTIGPFFPNEAIEQGSTPILTGVIISCAPLCVVILSPFIGYFLPHLGLRFTLLSGLWLVGGAYILLSFVAAMPSGWVFIVFCILLRLTEGTGTAMFTTSLFALLPELFPDSVGLLNGLMEFGASTGYALGPALGSVLYTAGGFKMPFLIVGSFCFLILLLAFFFIKQSSCKKQLLSLKVVAKLLTNLVFCNLAICNTLALASWAFNATTLQPFLTSQFHLDEEHVGLVFLSAPFISLCFAPVVGKLTDIFGPRQFTIAGCAMVGISYFLVGPGHFITEPKLWLTVVMLGFFGIGSAQILVATFIDMLTVAKKIDIGKDSQEALFGVVSGITSATLSFGEFSGALIGGGLTQKLDFPTSAVVFGEIYLAEGCLLLGVTFINQCTYTGR